MRRHAGHVLVVIVVRLFAVLDGAGRKAAQALKLPLGAAVWADTRVLLPPDVGSGLWEDHVSGARHALSGEQIAVAQVLRAFPGAVLLLETPEE
jgi:hypothetical protein